MNFDLSKIYHEQVNKQKVYLNPNIHQQFKVIEEGTERPHFSVSNIIRTYLAAKFPEKYNALTDSGKIKTENKIDKRIEIDITDLKQDLQAISADNSIPVTVELGETISAATSGKFAKDNYSSAFETIEFSAKVPAKKNKNGDVRPIAISDILATFDRTEGKGETSIAVRANKDNMDQLMHQFSGKDSTTITNDTYITLKGKDNTFSTPVKENLPGLCFHAGLQIPISPTGQSQIDNSAAALNALEKLTLILEAADNPPAGISPIAIRACKDAVKNMRGRITNSSVMKDGKEYYKLNGNDRNQLNGSISISTTLHNANFTPEKHIYLAGTTSGDSLHGTLKSYGGKLTGLQQDEWCPADIFIVENDFYRENSDIKKYVKSHAGEGATNEGLLNTLNALFTDEFSPAGIQDKTPILAISLKQAVAQGGKYKMFLLGRFEGNEGELVLEDEIPTSRGPINLTAEEQNYSLDDYLLGIKEFLNTIIQYEQVHKNVGFTPEDKNLLPEWNNILNQDDESFIRNIMGTSEEKLNEAFNFYGGNKDVWIKIKYSCLKILATMMTEPPDFFRQTLMAGRKIIGQNSRPHFYKMVEGKQGDIANIKKEFGMYLEVTSDYWLKNIFSKTASGLEVIMGTKESYDDGTVNTPFFGLAIRSQGNVTFDKGQVAGEVNPNAKILASWMDGS
jgi:hypothetical protein